MAGVSIRSHFCISQWALGKPQWEQSDLVDQERSGSFRAVGWVERSPNPLWAVILIIGVLQFPISWYVFVYIQAPSSAVAEFYTAYLGLPSIYLLGASGIFILGLPILSLLLDRLHSFEVSFEDKRDVGQGLELSYTLHGRAVVGPLKIRSVDGRRTGLYRSMGRFARPVKGTAATIGISFVNKRNRLVLGFPSVEEMESIYDELK
jgi:hypothetical protein